MKVVEDMDNNFDGNKANKSLITRMKDNLTFSGPEKDVKKIIKETLEALALLG